MINNATSSLRDAIITEMRTGSCATTARQQTAEDSDDNVEWPPGTMGGDGYLTWTWGGRLHPVPKGWQLPKGTVSMMFNLWVHGNAAMHIAPYRFIKAWDLCPSEDRMDLPLVFTLEARAQIVAKTRRTWATYLSQATDVMVFIQEHTRMTWSQLRALSATEREGKFMAAFTDSDMCTRMHGDITEEARMQRECMKCLTSLSTGGCRRRRCCARPLATLRNLQAARRRVSKGHVGTVAGGGSFGLSDFSDVF